MYKYAEGEKGAQERHTGPVLGKLACVCVMLGWQQMAGEGRRQRSQEELSREGFWQRSVFNQLSTTLDRKREIQIQGRLSDLKTRLRDSRGGL